MELEKIDMSQSNNKNRMIRWRLRVIMAERNIKNKTLAEKTGIHPTTISRLRITDELKQISGSVLDKLCNALECTPNDLIEFTPDPKNPEVINSQGDTNNLVQLKKTTGKSSSSIETESAA